MTPDLKELERLKADLEQTRVQLACCGVAAMQNTEESKANRVERGAYGWSASYGDVCRMVDREIELRAENARLKDDYQNACKTVAEMHAAAVGQIVGPNRGVVEDVADLRAERDDWKARAEAAEAELARVRAVEPVGEVRAKCDRYGGIFVIWKKLPIAGMLLYTTPPRPAAQEPFAWARPDAVDASQDFRFIKIDDFTVPLYTTPPSAVPVVEQLVEALSRNRIMAADSDGNYTREVTPLIITAAIAAGQQYLKENGK